MDPVELLADHQQRPRQMGKILDADLVGEVGSIITGDALRFYLQLEADGRIAEARFQVFGAQDMLASTSVLCELLPGHDLSRALELDAAAICAQLGGLPRERLPFMIWGLEALREAIAGVMDLPRLSDAELGELVCRCHGVSAERIREVVVDGGLESLDDIARVTGAGSGCGSCRRDIESLVDRLLGRRREQVVAKLAKGRVAAMRELQRVLQASLGDDDPQLELWDWRDDDVIVLRSADPTAVSEDLRRRLEERFHAELQTGFRVSIEST